MMTGSLANFDFTLILKRAVEYDEQCKYKEALMNYENGLELMLKSIKDCSNAATRNHMRDKFTEYMKRAESLKYIIKKDNDYKTEVIQIDSNATGYDYNSLFGKYLDDRVTEVVIFDPYIRAHHQILNLVRFCELLVEKTKVHRISLTTTQDDDAKKQAQRLAELVDSLKQVKVHLNIDISPTLHDREIKLNNGWTIKIGRGLDYFKAPEKPYGIGACDMKLRPCQETTVNIFHQNSIHNS